MQNNKDKDDNNFITDKEGQDSGTHPESTERKKKKTSQMEFYT